MYIYNIYIYIYIYIYSLTGTIYNITYIYIYIYIYMYISFVQFNSIFMQSGEFKLYWKTSDAGEFGELMLAELAELLAQVAAIVCSAPKEVRVNTPDIVSNV